MSKQHLPLKNRSLRYDAALKRRAAEQVFIHYQARRSGCPAVSLFAAVRRQLGETVSK